MKRCLLIAFCVLLVGCDRFEGAYSFLRQPPELTRLLGTYSINRVGTLPEEYSDHSGSITLLADGSCSFSNIPDCFVYGDRGYFGGYFTGEGEWSTRKNNSVYDVRILIRKIGRRELEKRDTPQRPGNIDITISKSGDGYALAVPLFDGEFSYVYLEKEANQPPQPTPVNRRG